jgi:hypothetical protein
MNDNARTYRFVFLTFLFCLLISWSVMQAVVMDDVRWLCIAWAACAAQWTLLNRKRVHDELCQPKPVIMQRPIEPEPQATEMVYRPQVQSPNGHKVRFGKFGLSQQQWAELAHVLFENDNRVVRDIIAKAKVFSSITEKWNAIYNEFERLGWARNGRLTDAGVEWFTGFLTPPAPTD